MTTSSIASSGVATPTTTTTLPLPSNILTTAQAQKQAAAAKSATTGTGTSSMGESDFLTLFTTQLKDQDPLNPADGANFVSQLAQFSQLEATTTMSTKMTNLVSSLSGQSLMSSANLIGGLVAVPNATQTLSGGVATPAIISLPNGADSVTIQVKDSNGSLINTYSLGKESAGNINWTWNGQTSQGGTAPDGKYTITANANVNGASSAATVSTLQTVTGVTQTNGTVMLNVSSGQTVSAGSVQYITSSANANANSVSSSSASSGG